MSISKKGVYSHFPPELSGKGGTRSRRGGREGHYLREASSLDDQKGGEEALLRPGEKRVTFQQNRVGIECPTQEREGIFLRGGGVSFKKQIEPLGGAVLVPYEQKGKGFYRALLLKQGRPAEGRGVKTLVPFLGEEGGTFFINYIKG